ncbi:MAG: hypothetical protein KJ057_01835 [Phycisphaerae bacterium]|nr:MAG: hypothetical protein F9K17_10320 [Phycisphaerae bacterium]MBE7455934.1 hypothetical protein [Planctomycetia bacterium]MBZ0172295.1 hypothetical protein [Phycisphaerales bacterium]MCK6464657.1 hypothetical protein [Phycisphaerae bacterium]MCL4717192.1 hypothetical protein [Phycisphaerae bacterium]
MLHDPNGIASSSPGLVAAGDLPWENEAHSIRNPNGVAAPDAIMQSLPFAQGDRILRSAGA